jgi:hypothetical protein
MSRAPGKYVAGAMVPAGAALDRPGLHIQDLTVSKTQADPKELLLCIAAYNSGDRVNVGL